MIKLSQLPFRWRRRIATIVTILAVLLTAVLAHSESSRLGRDSILTGATLLATIVLLMLLGIRRRLPFWRLGNMSTWTQIHIYSGFFAAGVYVMHVPALVADGPLELTLSLAFLAVTASGMYGIYASRTIPKRLTSNMEQYRFDLMPWHRDQISMAAHDLVKQIEEPSALRVLGNFFNQYLDRFFSSRPPLAYVIVPHGIRRRRLLSGLQQLDRYLETQGRDTAGALAALIRQRDDLDYQFALQIRLRLWVVFHSVLSVFVLVLSITHAILALRYMAL